LTEQQREFVREFVANGGYAEAAARSAGYVYPRQSAWVLQRTEPVAAEIRIALRREFDGLAVGATRKLSRVVGQDEDITGPQMSAVRTVLEVVGLIGPGRKAGENPSNTKALADMTLDELGDAMKRQEASLSTLRTLLSRESEPAKPAKASQVIDI
jgi:hypothetical protein